MVDKLDLGCFLWSVGFLTLQCMMDPVGVECTRRSQHQGQMPSVQMTIPGASERIMLFCKWTTLYLDINNYRHSSRWNTIQYLVFVLLFKGSPHSSHHVHQNIKLTFCRYARRLLKSIEFCMPFVGYWSSTSTIPIEPTNCGSPFCDMAGPMIVDWTRLTLYSKSWMYVADKNHLYTYNDTT